MIDTNDLLPRGPQKKNVKIWLLYDHSANGGPFLRLPQKYKVLSLALAQLGYEFEYIANLHKWHQAFETQGPLTAPTAMADLKDAQGLASKFTHKVVREKPALILLDSQSQLGLSIAMAAFYLKTPVVYLDAGFRRYDFGHYHIHQMHKKLISQLCQFHFCQTLEQVQNLNSEGLVAHALVTGDLLIDDALGVLADQGSQSLEGAEVGDTRPLVVLDATQGAEPLAALMLYKAGELLAGDPCQYRVILMTSARDYSVLGMNSGPVMCMPYPGFEAFYKLVAMASAFVTQCEAHQGVIPSLGVPLILVGKGELWPESQVCGASFKCQDTPQSIVQAVDQLIKEPPFAGYKTGQNPFGTGHAAEIMARAIHDLCTLYI